MASVTVGMLMIKENRVEPSFLKELDSLLVIFKRRREEGSKVSCSP